MKLPQATSLLLVSIASRLLTNPSWSRRVYAKRSVHQEGYAYVGTSHPQPSMFSHINLDQFVTSGQPHAEDPAIALIDTDRIRALCEPFYSDTGPPSIQLEKLFLSLLEGSLFWVTSERALVRELTGNLVLYGLWGWIWPRLRGITPRSCRTGRSGLPKPGYSNSYVMRRSPWPSSRNWSRRI